MLSDIEISRQATLADISQIATNLGLQPNELTLFGHTKAKVNLSVLKRLPQATKGKLIIVTAVTPTPYGEGKTVTTLGLTQSLQAIGKQVCACIRQPSMGPVFGVKGGAAGAVMPKSCPWKR